jgi:transcriptional regulator with GAF, ATPase, and Fis domain
VSRFQRDIATDIVGGGDGTGRRLIVLSGAGSQVIELPPRGRLVIGREEEADVRIEHSSVSRRHALLHLDAELRIEDLGSSNGTRVGGAALPAGQSVPVPIGTLMELGTAILVVQSDAPRGAEAPLRAAEPEEALVVASPTMQRVHQMLDVAARSKLSVLLLGETGVGKEVLATRVHRQSTRASKTFLKVNCAALVESLLESELFGYEKGAFTGANTAKIGLLEGAHEGTLFLDEVGELPLTTQAKLLRVLESGEVTRIGSLKPRAVDVRFVAATNRDLRDYVRQGRFRQDLFFRLDGVSIHIPPLRERAEEITPLAEAFLREAAVQMGKGKLRYSPASLQRLAAHSWPGNVRELRNVVQRAALFCASDLVDAPDLHFEGIGKAPVTDLPSIDPNPMPAYGSALGSPTMPPGAAPVPTGGGTPEDAERARILNALQQVGGNQTKAAELLGISRRTLINRMISLDLPRPRKA